MLERALLLAHGNPLSIKHFPGLEPISSSSPALPHYQDLNTLADIENAHIANMLKKFEGDKLKTSKALGISLSSLYRKIHHIK